MWKIPLFNGEFGQAELDAVQRPLLNNWLTMGQITGELEKTFAEVSGTSNAIAASGGSVSRIVSAAAFTSPRLPTPDPP